jgi:hypothetical protein
MIFSIFTLIPLLFFCHSVLDAILLYFHVHQTVYIEEVSKFLIYIYIYIFCNEFIWMFYLLFG